MDDLHEFKTPRTREVVVEKFFDLVVRRYQGEVPINEYDAVMRAGPHQEPEESVYEKAERLEPLRRALDPDGGVLDNRELWVLEAIYWRGLSYRQLAQEIPWSTTHLHRVKNDAVRKLYDHLYDTYSSGDSDD